MNPLIQSILSDVGSAAVDAADLAFQRLWVSTEIFDGVSSTALFLLDHGGRYHFRYEGLNDLDSKLIALREAYVASGFPAWSTATFAMDVKGKFKLDTGYEDVTDLGLQGSRQQIWVEKYLGKNVEILYD